MIGLLSAVFNISVCVGFPITVFIVLLARFDERKIPNLDDEPDM